jgi:predicted SAM-dependent methyltransferase
MSFQRGATLGKEGCILSRELVAASYLSGSGIEIGALHNPLVVPGHASVKYVDRLNRDELIEIYPEIDASKIVDTDIVADGETLKAFQDASQDFIIANHLIEHCQDPIGTLLNFFRVLKPSGILYMAIPDKRFTFDRDRRVTPLQHLLADHDGGSLGSDEDHIIDWCLNVDKVDRDQLENAVERQRHLINDKKRTIHFHAWTQVEMLEILVTLRKRLNVSFELEAFIKEGIECIIILRKSA